jgi:hypothetical protein
MNVDELTNEYRRLILEKRALASQPRLGNKLAPKIVAVGDQLKGTPEGRDALSRLMQDPEVGVRLMAAVDSWRWDERQATQVLEEVMTEPSFDAISARYALKGLRDGTR